jgi:hypothetical protein
VSIFHHENFGVTRRSSDEIRKALDRADLVLPRAGSVAWLLALERFVVLVTYRPPFNGAADAELLAQLGGRGSSLVDLDGVEGFAVALVDGKVQKEAVSKAGGVTLSSRELPVRTDDFSVVSGRDDASITIGGARYEAGRKTFLVLVYDPKSRTVLERAAIQPGMARQRRWADVAARRSPR